MTAPERLFLYGTLRHPPLLDVVAGRTIQTRHARLSGYALSGVEGAAIPMVSENAAGAVEGVVIDVEGDLGARLDYYEGGYGYDLRPVEVETDQGKVPARVYVPDPAKWRPKGDWELDRWVADEGALTVAAARDAMTLYGRWSPETLARRFPMVRARAWSRMIAGHAAAPSTLRWGDRRAEVTESRRERRHTGFFALDEVWLDHPTFAGGRSGEIVREAFVSTDASLVLPYDPVRDRVLLVEQFRTGPYMRGDPAPWALEPVAGLIDPGETPEAAAHREAAEEAGVTFRHLEPVIAGYPSPGATTEFYHCFVGLCDLDGNGGAGGLADEAEDIRTHVLARSEALDLITSGEVNVIPAAMLLLWLDANRDRLAALS